MSRPTAANVNRIRYIWICECNAGMCDFDTKREADERVGRSKFCGNWERIRKKRVTDLSPRTGEG
ncbi:MAG: hypothetical protein ACYTEQ_01000 [Planctomycetota bacterium]